MTTRLDRVRRLAEQDFTNAEIGEQLGISERQVIRLKHQAGVEIKDTRALPKMVIDEIHRLSAEEGWPAEEIMATLGVTRSAVDKYCVPGPGIEWRTIAARLARDHRALWRELRDKK